MAGRVVPGLLGGGRGDGRPRGRQTLPPRPPRPDHGRVRAARNLPPRVARPPSHSPRPGRHAQRLGHLRGAPLRLQRRPLRALRGPRPLGAHHRAPCPGAPPQRPRLRPRPRHRAPRHQARERPPRRPRACPPRRLWVRPRPATPPGTHARRHPRRHGARGAPGRPGRGARRAPPLRGAPGRAALLRNGRRHLGPRGPRLRASHRPGTLRRQRRPRHRARHLRQPRRPPRRRLPPGARLSPPVPHLRRQGTPHRSRSPVPPPPRGALRPHAPGSPRGCRRRQPPPRRQPSLDDSPRVPLPSRRGPVRIGQDLQPRCEHHGRDRVPLPHAPPAPGRAGPQPRRRPHRRCPARGSGPSPRPPPGRPRRQQAHAPQLRWPCPSHPRKMSADCARAAAGACVPPPDPSDGQGLGTVVSLAYAGAETNDRRGSRWGGMPGGMSAACGVKGSADNLATCRPEVAGLPALSLTRPTESGRASRTNKHDPPGRVRGRAARLLHWWCGLTPPHVAPEGA